MAIEELLPFPIGQTFFNGATPDTGSTSAELEGREFLIRDLDYSTSPIKARAGFTGTETKRVRIVRNSCPTGAGTATAVLPGYMCTFKAGQYGKQVDGYCTTDAQEAYPADEFLPAAGCPLNDLFYITVSGPASIITSLGADATDVFSAGSVIVALTAATSGATTSGRIQSQLLNTTSTTLGNNVQNRVGVALSASTTANTNALKLIFINYRL